MRKTTIKEEFERAKKVAKVKTTFILILKESENALKDIIPENKLNIMSKFINSKVEDRNIPNLAFELKMKRENLKNICEELNIDYYNYQKGKRKKD